MISDGREETAAEEAAATEEEAARPTSEEESSSEEKGLLMKKVFAAIAIGLLGIFAMNVAYAADEENPPNVTVEVSGCEATLTFDNTGPYTDGIGSAGPWNAEFDYKLPGDVQQPLEQDLQGVIIQDPPLTGKPFDGLFNPVLVPAGEKVAKTIALDPTDSTIEYRLVRGPEQRVFFDWKLEEIPANECVASPSPPVPTADDGDFCDILETLTVKEEPERVGYDRELFGNYDREKILAANKEGENYISLFDNQSYTDPEEVDVDHVVALAEAWDSGIAEADREAFGGDADNLLLLTKALNQSKGDKDAAEWNPPHDPADGAFASVVVNIKAKYNLSVDSAEHAALTTLLGCSAGGVLPTPSALPVTGDSSTIGVLGLVAVGIAIGLFGVVKWLQRRRDRFSNID